jgi:surface antigen
MARPIAALFALLTALALGGCDMTTGSIGPLAAFSSTPAAPAKDRAAAAAVTSAAMGGLISAKIGAALDDEDRRLAQAAQLEALDNGAPGAPVPWRNPASGRYGNIVPGPAYNRQGDTCRGYSHTVSISGQLEIARGTACRAGGGAWTAAG